MVRLICQKGYESSFSKARMSKTCTSHRNLLQLNNPMLFCSTFRTMESNMYIFIEANFQKVIENFFILIGMLTKHLYMVAIIPNLCVNRNSSLLPSVRQIYHIIIIDHFVSTGDKKQLGRERTIFHVCGVESFQESTVGHLMFDEFLDCPINHSPC